MTKSTGKRPRYGSDLATKLAFYSRREGECLIWTAGVKDIRDPRHHYGVLNWQGKPTGAHRLSWELANGRKIRKGMDILHSCDNPRCIEPAHLREGTDLDNMRDREARGRGRQPKGEATGRAKLTEAQVLAIRDDPRGKRPVAAHYGVSKTLVMLIRQRKAWKHI